MIRSEHGYSYDGLVVRPLIEEDLLAYLYLRLQQDGGLKHFCHENVPTVTEFIRLHAGTKALGCFEESTSGGVPALVGMGFADPIQLVRTKTGVLSKAETGMAFIRGTKRTIDFGLMMLKWAFEELDLDVAYGTTPAPNKLALRFREKLGFRTVGEAPLYTVYDGEPCSVIISAVTREQFDEFLLEQVEVET